MYKKILADAGIHFRGQASMRLACSSAKRSDREQRSVRLNQVAKAGQAVCGSSRISLLGTESPSTKKGTTLSSVTRQMR